MQKIGLKFDEVKMAWEKNFLIKNLPGQRYSEAG